MDKEVMTLTEKSFNWYKEVIASNGATDRIKNLRSWGIPSFFSKHRRINMIGSIAAILTTFAIFAASCVCSQKQKILNRLP